MIRIYLGILMGLVLIQGTLAQPPSLVVDKSVTPSLISIDEIGISSEDIQVKLALNPPSVNRVDADVVLALDCSASMFHSDRDVLRRAASKVFLSKLDPAKDRASVILWNDQPFDNCLLVNNFNTCNETLDRIPDPDKGGTNANEALRSSIKMLESSSRANNSRVSHSIIFLTDGDPEGSMNNSYFDEDLMEYAKDKKYRVYTVGLDPYILSIPFLKELATRTGGIYVQAKNNRGLIPIYENLSEIIPYDVLATEVELIDILPPYLAEPRNFEISPKYYWYTQDESPDIDVKSNDLDLTKTIRWKWGTVYANSEPLILTFTTRFERPLPADVVTYENKEFINSKLVYIDAEGSPKASQIEAKAIDIKAKEPFMEPKVIGVSIGLPLIAFSIPFFKWRKEKEKNK